MYTHLSYDIYDIGSPKYTTIDDSVLFALRSLQLFLMDRDIDNHGMTVEYIRFILATRIYNRISIEHRAHLAPIIDPSRLQNNAQIETGASCVRYRATNYDDRKTQDKRPAAIIQTPDEPPPQYHPRVTNRPNMGELAKAEKSGHTLQTANFDDQKARDKRPVAIKQTPVEVIEQGGSLVVRNPSHQQHLTSAEELNSIVFSKVILMGYRVYVQRYLKHPVHPRPQAQSYANSEKSEIRRLVLTLSVTILGPSTGKEATA
jgi:hypothetical protein